MRSPGPASARSRSSSGAPLRRGHQSRSAGGGRPAGLRNRRCARRLGSRRRRLRGLARRPASGAGGDRAAAPRKGVFLDGRAPARGTRSRCRRGAPDPADLDDATAARLLRARRSSASTRSWKPTTRTSSTRNTTRRPVLGVNARDLGTFRIDRGAQLELVAKAPRDRIVVAESAIQTRAQAAAAELAGADAVLVGTSLMRAAEPGSKLQELLSRRSSRSAG
jgi:Indole-3-glycerol phosphate synthase